MVTATAVEPSVLRWARESSGISVQEAAQRAKVDSEELVRWESGKRKPSVAELERLARAYKRSLAVFYLPAPPDEGSLPRDFRTLPEARSAFSPKTLLAFRRARRVQGVSAELARNLARGSAHRLRQHRISDDPERVSALTRGELGVGVEAQRHWSSDSEALRAWRAAVERQGVLVLQLSVPLAELRGFSLADQAPPVVVLNATDVPTARAFSLFHELAHVLIATPGICTMDSPPSASTSARDAGQSVEVFCNRFAGALLVPAQALRARIAEVGRHNADWPDSQLRDLARSFRVSPEVIFRRLVLLGLASDAAYERRRHAWQARGQPVKRGGYGRPPAEKCLRSNGAAAVSLVLEAHEQGAITRRDVADYLDLRLEHLPEVERLLRRARSA